MISDLKPVHFVLAVPILGVGILIGYLMGTDDRGSGPASQSGPVTPPEATQVSSSGPMTLLGVTIDQPISLPKCDNKNFDFLTKPNDPWDAYYKGDKPCYVEFVVSKELEAEFAKSADPAFRGRKEFRIKMPPNTEPSYVNEIEVSTLHDKVALITVQTNGAAGQELAYDELVEKFGHATSVQKDTLQNGFGAQYGSIIATWEIAPQNVIVDFYGIIGDRDHGEIKMVSSSYKKAEEEAVARHPKAHL